MKTLSTSLGEMPVCAAMRPLVAAVLLAVANSSALAETICVKYGQCPLDLAAFKCSDVTRSFIKRVCYDASKSFMVIELAGTWYPYCAIGAGDVQKLLGAAESSGKFYNSTVRSHGSSHGPFDCRDHPMPKY